MGDRTRIVPLTTGADLRRRNEGGRRVALLVNGGTAKLVPGTWSSTSELLARRLAPRHPDWELAELRYRVKSWKAFAACVADARAALELLASEAPRPVVLVGFSMGGAVSIATADHPTVVAVLGLAPWIPDQLEVDPLAGKRFDVIHGAWDRWLPGVPGVSPASSRRGFERIRAAGIDGSYTVLPRAMHGAALRRPSGGLQPLPRASRWVDEVSAVLARDEITR
ncbi:MAG: alpha/beta fold hydrolase [Gaiellales bacterium]